MQSIPVGWDRLSPFIAKCPQDIREELKSIIAKGQLVAKTLQQATVGAPDTVAEAMAIAVTICRASWLQASGMLRQLQCI